MSYAIIMTIDYLCNYDGKSKQFVYYDNGLDKYGNQDHAPHYIYVKPLTHFLHTFWFLLMLFIACNTWYVAIEYTELTGNKYYNKSKNNQSKKAPAFPDK